jgi:hypothetical protein
MERKMNFIATKRIQTDANPPQSDSMAKKLSEMKVSAAIVARAKATIENSKIPRKRAPLA